MINLFFKFIELCLKLFVTGLVVLFTPINDEEDESEKL